MTLVITTCHVFLTQGRSQKGLMLTLHNHSDNLHYVLIFNWVEPERGPGFSFLKMVSSGKGAIIQVLVFLGGTYDSYANDTNLLSYFYFPHNTLFSFLVNILFQIPLILNLKIVIHLQD